MHIAAVARQVQDGVTHHLTGPVEGRIPSPADTIHGNLPGIQQMSLVSTSAQRKNRRMLKQQKRVLPLSLTPLPKHFFLPGECLGIFN